MSDKRLESETYEQHKGHGADWLRWLGWLSGRKATGLEIGTFRGESAQWWLEHILTHEDSRLYCVDTFEGSAEHALGGVDVSTLEHEARSRLKPFGEKVVIVKERSEVALKHLSTEPFDFCYVDASHDAENVLRDSVLAFSALRVGGIIVWDDYEWHVMEQAVDCPKIAIDAFVRCYARSLEVIGMGFQVAAKKIR